MTKNVLDKSYERLLDAARNYAAADKSDPFAYRRAYAHLKNGIATVTRGQSASGLKADDAAYYDAEPTTEVRRVLTNRGEYEDVKFPIYRNMVRP